MIDNDSPVEESPNISESISQNRTFQKVTPNTTVHPHPIEDPHPLLHMKTTPTSLLHRVHVAAIAVAALGLSTPLQAATFTWDGGAAASNSWGNLDNWNPNAVPTFNNTADLLFNSLTRPDNDLGAARTVRSITYGADMDGAFLTNFRTFNGGAAAALTMQADSGNASISVDANATGNITLGWNGVGTAGGALTLGSNLDIIHNGSGELLINRQITGAGFGFTKTGTGTVRIASANANSFTGTVGVSQGRLIMGSTSAAGADLNTASSITLSGGALEMRTTSALNKTLTPNMTVTASSTLAYNNTTATTQSLTVSTGTMILNGNLTVQNISSGTTLANQILITRNMTGAGDLIVDTYNNVTSSTPSTDFGLGRVALGGDNSAWTGNLVITKGTAQLFGDTALGQFSLGTGDIILGETGNSSGAGFLLAASTPTAGGKTLSNDIIVRSGGFRTIRGGSDHTYNLNGNILLEGDLNVHNGLFFTDKHMILNGNISGVGGLSLTESGNPGFIRLTGSNTYSGATSVGTGAVLNILSASGNAIGDSSAVTFAGAGSTLVFNSTNEAVGSIASAATDGAINLGANTLTTGGNNQSTSFGGVINGTGGNLIKVGSGTMTLTAAQTYTGGTTLTAGTLVLGTGATLASNNIQIGAGTNLDASGLGSALTIAAGNRIGGDGTLTGDLTLDSSAQFVFTLTSTLDVTGTVTLANSFGVASLVNADGSDIDWTTVGVGTYTLIANAGDFSNITNFGEAFAVNNVGGSGNKAYFQNGSLQLVVAVPEPTTMVLLTAGLTTVMAFRRRRHV